VFFQLGTLCLQLADVLALPPSLFLHRPHPPYCLVEVGGLVAEDHVETFDLLPEKGEAVLVLLEGSGTALKLP
jgi:hypothetical protein